jgi:hypothetical protein
MKREQAVGAALRPQSQGYVRLQLAEKPTVSYGFPGEE